MCQVPRYKFNQPLPEADITEAVTRFPHKFNWFVEKGYAPHAYQILFHGMAKGEQLCRYRHLVAGRRGGKTLSAAWEILYYVLHPQMYHWHAHREKSDRPLHVWILTPDRASAGRAALLNMREVIRKAGLGPNEAAENRSDKIIEFENGSLIEFKTAERPEQLVGAGLDMLWIDEAAVIPSEDAWNIARPALSDKEGLVIGTTTPRGKNWYYELFWSRKVLESPDIGTVEYRSIDNPYFPAKEWEEQRANYHPLLFKREYMAEFDAMAGVELSGDWLHYYELDELPRHKERPEEYDLDLYIGIDPAVSLADTADRFAMALIGKSKLGHVYLLELYADRIPFPEQLEKIDEWHRQYRPQYIGIESNAFQRALEQQVARLPSLPNTIPVYAKGHKYERILSMAPLFQRGRVKILKTHYDFIEEWLNYDSQLKNPKDDCLDAVEIALRTAGVLLPETPHEEHFTELPIASIEELARREWEGIASADPKRVFDEHLGDLF